LREGAIWVLALTLQPNEEEEIAIWALVNISLADEDEEDDVWPKAFPFSCTRPVLPQVLLEAGEQLMQTIFFTLSLQILTVSSNFIYFHPEKLIHRPLNI